MNTITLMINLKLKYDMGPCKYDEFGVWSLVKKRLKSISAKKIVF